MKDSIMKKGHPSRSTITLAKAARQSLPGVLARPSGDEMPACGDADLAMPVAAHTRAEGGLVVRTLSALPRTRPLNAVRTSIA